MNAQEIKDLWDSLNEEYGLDLALPDGIAEKVNSFPNSDIEFEMAMGGSFDGAMQNCLTRSGLE